MCYPLAIAALALTAAGTGLSIAGQNAANSAREKALSNSVKEQDQSRNEASAIFNQNTANQTPADYQKNIKDAATQREGEYQAAQQSAPGLVNLPKQGESPTVVNEANRKFSDLSMFRNQQNQQAALLAGYGDAQFGQNLANNRVGQDLGRVSNFAEGNLRTLPFELDSAGHAGDSLRLGGTIASALGTIAGLGAASGIGAGATAAGGAGAAGTGIGSLSAAQQAAMIAAPLGQTATTFETMQQPSTVGGMNDLYAQTMLRRSQATSPWSILYPNSTNNLYR